MTSYNPTNRNPRPDNGPDSWGRSFRERMENREPKRQPAGFDIPPGREP